ncbi:MAG TPA: BlaI/MecI/CopY family transcriptional regulator [Thermoanaerobaculia bacterium]|jgi:predicted transcriptional regulator|nr:BlaI/MecI/CopY family transcriptional regulator [Thermoanaerobaculia bacterium]
MARAKTTAEPLTPLELEIMKVLWETGPAAVQAVQEHLAPERKLAYNTVQTMLNVLQRKSKVTRELQGRAFLYAPAVSRAQASRQALGDLVHRMFDGSAESLVLSLVEARQLTPEKLAELSALIDKSEEEDGDERA